MKNQYLNHHGAFVLNFENWDLQIDWNLGFENWNFSYGWSILSKMEYIAKIGDRTFETMY